MFPFLSELKEGIKKNRVFAKCPCLNCNYGVPINRGAIRRNHNEAIEAIIRHIGGTHGFEDILEVLERVIARQIEEDARK